MASILPGVVVSDIRGSVGSATFQRSRGQYVLMRRARQRNRQTKGQLERRALGKRRAAEWQALSDSEREAWRRAAETFEGARDRFGRARRMGAYEFWLYQRMDLEAESFPPGGLPNELIAATQVSEIEVTTPIGGPWHASHDGYPGTSSWVGPIFGARSFSRSKPGSWRVERMIFNGRYVDSSPDDLQPLFEAALGAPALGEWIRFRTRRIMSVPRFRGPDVIYETYVTV